VIGLQCPYCGFQWRPKIRKPKACPGCKRYFWKKTPIEVELPEVVRESPLKEVIPLSSESYVKCELCENKAEFYYRGTNICRQHLTEILVKKIPKEKKLPEVEVDGIILQTVRSAESLREALQLSLQQLIGQVPEDVISERVERFWRLERE